jgi:hypothetical protein
VPIVVIPAFGIVLAGIFCALILASSKYWVKAVAAVIPNWHIPGFSALRDWVLTQTANLVQILDNAFSPVADMAGTIVAAPVAVLKALLSGLRAGIVATASTVVWIVHHGIPDAIHALHLVLNAAVLAARHYATLLVHNLHALVNTLIAQVSHYATLLVHNLHALVNTLIAQTRHYAKALVVTLAASVVADLAAVRTYAAGLVHQVHAVINTQLDQLARSVKSDVANLTKYVDSEVAVIATTTSAAAVAAAGALVTDLDHGVAAAVDAVWPDVVAGVKGLEGVIGTDLDDIMAGLRNVDLTKPASIAAALAGVTALAIPMVRYMRDCGVPNCRNLSHYGRLIHELSGIVADGSLMAMFVGLAADPTGAAHAISDVLSPLVDDTVGGAKSLFGVG